MNNKRNKPMNAIRRRIPKANPLLFLLASLARKSALALASL